jgi:NADPH:quinone reductase-like Zn-dependent oxidoreductase
LRAVLLTKFGGPEALEFREDVPEPEPAAGEVRLRVGATALNNTDVWTREGAYGSDVDENVQTGWRREAFVFPRIQRADVVGHIDRVGERVQKSRIGERVMVDPMIYFGGERELVDTDYLGSERDGGFAEFVTVPAANAHPIISSLSDAELATFPTAYATAMRMLNRARVDRDETVLVTGASGGVGSALVQLACARGAVVFAIAGKGKAERVAALGARGVIGRDVADIPAALGQKVDVVADVVGGRGFGNLLRSLRSLGRYVVAGAMAGPHVKADLRTIYLNQLEVIGSSFGSHGDFADVLALIERGEIQPLLSATYPLSDLASAQAAFAAKEFVGKIVVTP